MATLTSTGVTFSDGTALASAAPTVSQVGSIVAGCYIVTSPSASNFSNSVARYGAGLTVAGSSIAYDISFTSVGPAGGATVGIGERYFRSFLANGYQTTQAFPPNGAQGSNYVAGCYLSTPAINQTSNNPNNTSTYSTLSGSWRSLSPMMLTNSNLGGNCGAWSTCTWPCILWIRYA